MSQKIYLVYLREQNSLFLYQITYIWILKNIWMSVMLLLSQNQHTFWAIFEINIFSKKYNLISLKKVKGVHIVLADFNTEVSCLITFYFLTWEDFLQLSG